MIHYFRHPPSLQHVTTKFRRWKEPRNTFWCLRFNSSECQTDVWPLNHLIGPQQVQGTLRIKGIPGITVDQVSSWWFV